LKRKSDRENTLLQLSGKKHVAVCGPSTTATLALSFTELTPSICGDYTSSIMRQPKIVVVGTSNVDIVVKAPRIPRPGETVLGGDWIQATGGKGANQAVAAARLGARVYLVACVGTDAFGDTTWRNLTREGLDLTYISRLENAPTGIALIIIDENGQNSIAVAPGANSRLSVQHVEAAAKDILDCDAVLVQLEIPLETAEYTAKVARQGRATVILNPAPAQPLNESFLRSVDILTPNEVEASILAGLTVSDLTSAERAARLLLSHGPRHVIITLGSQGALWAHRDGIRHVPGFPVQAVDSTAAGDAFNGALACAIARGVDMPQAIGYANAVGALSVTRIGAQPSLPHAPEVETFLATQT
jgi:ribokinase